MVVNEILLMRMCQHPSIVAFNDAYLVEGTLWVAMEFIDGEDLTQIIAANKLTEPQIAACLRAVRISIMLRTHGRERERVPSYEIRKRLTFISTVRTGSIDRGRIGTYALERNYAPRYQVR